MLVQFACCGANGPSDYVTPPGPPASCCRGKLVGGKCNDVYSNGCSKTLYEATNSNSHTTGYVLITTALIVVNQKIYVVLMYTNNNYTFVLDHNCHISLMAGIRNKRRT